MDTRSKIVDGDTARRLADAGAVVVSGYFDPLTASHARRLAELKVDGAPLLVAIAVPAGQILPARARAELVASLTVVNHVVESVDGLTPAFRLEQEDDARRAALIQHVHARQSAAS